MVSSTELRVAYSLEEVIASEPRQSAVTLGVFDGVHRGHRRIIESLIQCRASGLVKSCHVVTFDPHPVVVTHSRITPPILSSIDERIDLLRSFPLDGIFVVHFDEKVADTDYRTFLDRYLLKALDMKVLVLGYDCHFGKNREGSPEKVEEEGRKRGFKVKIVPPQRYQGEIVSSTHIRNKLLEGDLGGANALLGHPYTVAGKVVPGHGKGRSLGFPTANITVDNPYKLWPPSGVHAVSVRLRGEVHFGIMNVGRAPTLKNLQNGAREIEVHIFDFEGDLYGETLFVYCQAFLREERSFPSAEMLKRQLEADRETALRILGAAA